VDGVIFSAAAGVHSGIRNGAQCQKGWMLTHTMSGGSPSSLTFSFAVSVEKSDPAGLGMFQTANVILTDFLDAECLSCATIGLKDFCNCWAGKWFHVVGTYVHPTP